MRAGSNRRSRAPAVCRSQSSTEALRDTQQAMVESPPELPTGGN